MVLVPLFEFLRIFSEPTTLLPQIDKKVVERVWNILEPAPSDVTVHLNPRREGFQEEEEDVTVESVYRFLSDNNPSEMWRSERERALLEGGLGALEPEERQYFIGQWKKYQN
eukprot:sb/3477059/